MTIIERLPVGITKMACHPGLDCHLASSYRLERLREVEALCEARVRAALDRESVTLCHF